MKRIIIICEGETEQEFCKKTLYPHFLTREIIIQASLIKKTRGGIASWASLKKQIENHLKEDSTAFVTTLIDYYGIYRKDNFPKWDESIHIVDKNERMNILESGMYHDIHDDLRSRFLPYMQLHEFEGLLFNNVNIFYQIIPQDELVGEDELLETFNHYENPEMINDQVHTSPSHRLKRIILGYNKIVYGNIIAETIGLPQIRSKSPRFNGWIIKLENI